MESNYDDYSDTVLYDVFFETGTQLGGALVALENQADLAGDEAEVERWGAERRKMRAERRAISGRDRAAQIEAIRSWSARRQELLDLIGTDHA